MDQLERTIHELVLSVAREKSPEMAGIENGQGLTAGLGLDSLDIARIIAVLELQLGVDPFASLFAITDVRTVGDLCTAYRTALGSPVGAPTVSSFESSVHRAEARRSVQPPAEPPI
jgi:acyl carrier protein